ncbi:Putative ribonuclease H protein At1g65750 [Linum perenne]
MPNDLITAGPASIVWPLLSSGRFSVGSLRRALTTIRFPGDQTYPSKFIWTSGVPPKIKAFCWMLSHSKIATTDNLQTKGFQTANRCALCCRESESINHLFLLCDFSVEVWNRISSKLSIHGPLGNCIIDVFSAWKGMNCSPFSDHPMKFILHAFCWTIWIERNNRIFNDKKLLTSQIFHNIMMVTGRWLKAAKLFSADDLLGWNGFIFDPG